MPRVVIDDNHRSRQNAEDINVVTSLAIQVKLIFLTLGFFLPDKEAATYLKRCLAQVTFY